LPPLQFFLQGQASPKSVKILISQRRDDAAFPRVKINMNRLLPGFLMAALWVLLLYVAPPLIFWFIMTVGAAAALREFFRMAVKSVDNKLGVKGEHPAENSDAWLITKVKTTLLFHSNVSSMTEVSAKDGIVTLRGNADSKAEKDLTTEYAKDVEGVKDVNNEMTVSGAPKKKATMGEKIDDASITAQVKMTLLSHRSTSAVHTKAETKNGVVTLSGKAENAAEIDLVTKLVSDVKGVKRVKNKMTIGQSK
jgi:osmotically-inducible protein OsmY